MRRLSIRFRLSHLMAAVAVAAVVCWALFAAPFEVQALLVIIVGPLIGACRGLYLSRVRFPVAHQSGHSGLPRRPHPGSPSPDRFIAAVGGGINGALVEGVVLSGVAIVTVVCIKGYQGVGWAAVFGLIAAPLYGSFFATVVGVWVGIAVWAIVGTFRLLLKPLGRLRQVRMPDHERAGGG